MSIIPISFAAPIPPLYLTSLYKKTECITHNKAIVAQNVTLSDAAVSLKQLEHRLTTRVHGNVTNKDFGRHRRGSCRAKTEKQLQAFIDAL